LQQTATPRATAERTRRLETRSRGATEGAREGEGEASGAEVEQSGLLAVGLAEALATGDSEAVGLASDGDCARLVDPYAAATANTAQASADGDRCM
jgi:hypothetical protein